MPALAAVWAVATVLVYTVAARLVTGEWAYPLDDAWIHQTLARSFAQTGTFAVNPGEPIAGSTSPLWTVLIAAGYASAVPVYLWTAALGALCFAGTLALVRSVGNLLFPAMPVVGLAAAIFTAVDWRHAWAAASGMETGLFVVLTLALVRLSVVADTPLPLLGVVGALTVLTRPEGVVLFAGAFALRVLHIGDGRGRLVSGGMTLVLALAVVAPVFVYHLQVFGSPLPATFFAKGAYYREPMSLALVARYLGNVISFLALGPLLVLAPAAIIRVATGPIPRQISRHLVPAGWLLVLPIMYLVWLPYLYHHGRYLFPILPLATLYATAGAVMAAARIRPHFPLLPRVMAFIAVAVGVTLWANGAAVFAVNVQTIQGLQVTLARWIATETQSGATIATHDIGAVGYYGNRRIIDMAGLITPALTATPRDRDRILKVLQDERVEYVALLTDWYAWFPPNGLSSTTEYRTMSGGTYGSPEFTVYRVTWP